MGRRLEKCQNQSAKSADLNLATHMIKILLMFLSIRKEQILLLTQVLQLL